MRILGQRHRRALGRARLRVIGRLGRLGHAVPGRHRQPDDIGERAGVVIGDIPDDGGHLGPQDWLGRHHPQQRRQLAIGVRGRRDLEHVAVALASGEPDLHPAPRDHLGRHRLGNGVVKGSIEMRQRHVHRHPRDPRLVHVLDARGRIRRFGCRGGPGPRLDHTSHCPGHSWSIARSTTAFRKGLRLSGNIPRTVPDPATSGRSRDQWQPQDRPRAHEARTENSPRGATGSTSRTGATYPRTAFASASARSVRS